MVMRALTTTPRLSSVLAWTQGPYLLPFYYLLPSPPHHHPQFVFSCPTAEVSPKIALGLRFFILWVSYPPSPRDLPDVVLVAFMT
jgi:hypothetical protein